MRGTLAGRGVDQAQLSNSATSFTEYEAHGWKLCGVRPGSKGPDGPGWSTTPMPAETIEALGYGAGLLHALSGTCAIDIDQMELARPWLAERGVDVDALMQEPSAVMISSGRPGRAKLLYRLSRPLRTIKPKGSGVELRCAAANGNSVQDVLPPTIHPDTNKKPYTWKYGDELVAHWSNIPTIPAALARLWKDELHAAPPTEVGDERPQAQHPKEYIRKAIMAYIERHNIDVSDYNQWLDIGMKLHEETNSSADGLEIWNEWSRTDHSKRSDGSPRYQGFLAVKAKYLTFGQGGGPRTTMKGGGKVLRARDLRIFSCRRIFRKHHGTTKTNETNRANQTLSVVPRSVPSSASRDRRGRPLVLKAGVADAMLGAIASSWRCTPEENFCAARFASASAERRERMRCPSMQLRALCRSRARRRKLTNGRTMNTKLDSFRFAL